MRIEPAGALVGHIAVPGDKSISHRAVLIGALSDGETHVRGFGRSADTESTIAAARALGVEVEELGDDELVVRGAGLRGLRAPDAPIDCGNAGTLMRLLAGILAGQEGQFELTGDESLRARPMDRVAEPLKRMRARITTNKGLPPIVVQGTDALVGIDYALPMASAQVKSAILFAGLTGQVPVTITEPYRSRDHTERLFVHLGLGIHERNGAIVYEPSGHSNIPSFQLSVPGDPSSAAFLVAAAVLAEGGELLVENVGINPTRTGFLVVLERMGAHVERVNLRDEGGEPVADLVVRPAHLTATEVTAAEIPTLVDEVPVLAVLASRARGATVFREVGELRVKESNRLDLIAANLRAVGVNAEAQNNDLHVEGSERPPRGKVETASDHRLAMAFAVLGTVHGASVRLSERKSVAISYPSFFTDLKRIRADVQT